MPLPNPEPPSWDRLFEIALGQEGLFTTAQAAEAGYSPQLIVHHVRAGRVVRLQRGIYRVVHFPAGEHEELIAVWLWSDRTGVISHQTALALHGLSDALPARVHLTMPSAWRHRRFRAPAEVELHYADVLPEERSWFGAVPTTNPKRTLSDCACERLSPELLQHAAQQALRRGLVTKAELTDVERVLHDFGGLNT